jgi:hypothetical protein
MARVRKRMHAAVTTGTAETSRPSPRDGLTVAPRSPRGPAVLPPSPACSSKHANLASAPGCQDHTAWPSAKAHRTRRNDRLNLRPPKPRGTCRPMSLVWQHRRGHRSPPHVRDDRDTSLSSRRDGRRVQLIWGPFKADYFSGRIWTRLMVLKDREKLVFTRGVFSAPMGNSKAQATAHSRDSCSACSSTV